MKNFRVEVRFQPTLKVSWWGANPGGGSEFDQWRYVPITDTLELRPQYEAGRFVSAYIVEARTGSVSVVLDSLADYRLAKKALEEARNLVKLPALEFGHGVKRRKK